MSVLRAGVTWCLFLAAGRRLGSITPAAFFHTHDEPDDAEVAGRDWESANEGIWS